MHYGWMLRNISSTWYFLSFIACSMDFTWCLGQNQDTQFTFVLPAGRTECFYETTLKNWSLEVEYQVIAGAGLDVGFVLISPSGFRLASDFRKSDGIHMVELTEDGDYRLCFDNSFSKLSEKMVFFEVILDGKEDVRVGEQWTDMAAAADSMVEYKLENIRASMDLMYRHLEKSRQVQAMLRAYESRDRYLLEDNQWRVSFWSCLNLLVMLTVGAAQIYTLRRLFDDKRNIST